MLGSLRRAPQGTAVGPGGGGVDKWSFSAWVMEMWVCATFPVFQEGLAARECSVQRQQWLEVIKLYSGVFVCSDLCVLSVYCLVLIALED